MKNINNCAKMSSICLCYKDYGMALPIKDNGYCACLEFENDKEIKDFIKNLKKLLKQNKKYNN